jgi:2,3-bisphosphoglycerate-dependent phosphoglycerate mutase
MSGTPSPSPSRLTLVRHGETEWNREGRMQGHGDSPLSKEGERQVQALARRLKDTSFDHLYSSDLGRARSSAAAIAGSTGHPVHIDPDLRERHMGLFEGLTPKDIQVRYPEEYVSWKSPDPTRANPGGESIEACTRRMYSCCSRLVEKHPGSHIVAVTHGGVLSNFLRHILGIPEETARHFKIPNASLNVFLYDEKGWWLQTWGDVSHLE